MEPTVNYAFNPYGKQLSSTGTTQNKVKYANGYQDVSTGLYKYGARYYNVADGRWTQPDPSGQDAHYVYAGNNPVNFQDPSGLRAIDCAANIGLGLGGGILGVASSGFALLTAPTVAGAAVGGLGMAVGGATFLYSADQILNQGVC